MLDEFLANGEVTTALATRMSWPHGLAKCADKFL